MKLGIFLLGFVAALLAFMTITLIVAHYQSDCGIRAVIGFWLPKFRYCNDDIVRIGFPFRVIEEGGFVFRSSFDPGALMADILVAIGASAAVGWVAQRVR